MDDLKKFYKISLVVICYLFIAYTIKLWPFNEIDKIINHKQIENNTINQSYLDKTKDQNAKISGYFSLYTVTEGAGMYLYFYTNGNLEIWSCIQGDCELAKVKYRISNNTIIINTLDKEVAMWVNQDFKIEGNQLTGNKGDIYLFNGEKTPLELTFESNKILRSLGDKSKPSENKKNIENIKPIFSAETVMDPGEYFVNGSFDDKAYLYSKPDFNYIKKAYFTSVEKVFIRKFENNFGYVEFINSNGQLSKGWVSVKYIIKQKETN